MARNLGDKADAWLSPDTRQVARRHQLHKQPPSSSFNIKLKLHWDQANLRSVALKTFRTDPSFDDHPCSQLVEYETKSMDRITSHHNIVRLIDVIVRSPSNICLVMEAAATSRGNLMETIAAAPEGRFTDNAAVFYLVQLLSAVQHCHSKGVCHRDIQPQHLLVDPRSGNIKLSSFGRAGVWDTTAGDATDLAYASSAAVITYSAPEVVEGSKYCGKAADCWSVGATLFTMLAGFSPFKTDEAEVGGYDRYFQPPPWISPPGRSLLEGMLEPDPEKRFTMAEVNSHPWFGLKRGDGTSNRGSSPRYRSSSSSSSSGAAVETSDSSGGGESSRSPSDSSELSSSGERCIVLPSESSSDGSFYS